MASKLEDLDTEIESVQKQISDLQKLKASLSSERNKVYNDYRKTLTNNVSSTSSRYGADYTEHSSTWGDKMKQIANSVFGIPSFRFCQEAVINAALDGRNAIVVMPTGGGKSLCYQLPAVMVPGVTLVVSPLISLMTDQVLHLQESVSSRSFSAEVPRARRQTPFSSRFDKASIRTASLSKLDHRTAPPK